MIAILLTIYCMGIIISYKYIKISFGQCRVDFLIRIIWTMLGLLSWFTIIGFMIQRWMSRYDDHQYKKML